MLGPNKKKATGEKRKLHNEELQNLCLSPDIIRIVTSTTVRLEGHVEQRKRREMHIGFWWVNLKEKTAWKTKA
jgi:hypothetical protein